jgi:hypothetical protein
MTKYCHRKVCSNLASKGFLPLDEFMKQMEAKKQLTIGIREGFEDSHTGTSQGSTDCAPAHALCEEEEEEEEEEEAMVAVPVAVVAVAEEEEEDEDEDEDEVVEVAMVAAPVAMAVVAEEEEDEDEVVEVAMVAALVAVAVAAEVGQVVVAAVAEEEEEEEECQVSSQKTVPAYKSDEPTIKDKRVNECEGEAEHGEGGLSMAALLEDLQRGIAPEAPHTAVDNVLDVLCDLPMLCMAWDRLALMGKDKAIDVLFRARIISVVGMLNLFLDLRLTFTWREASFIISKAQGHGTHHA